MSKKPERKQDGHEPVAGEGAGEVRHAPSDEATTEHHDRMFALHDHFSVEAYEAIEELIREVLDETRDLETADAVSVMRELSGMVHDRGHDIDGLALARMHGLDLSDEHRDASRDQMFREHPDTQDAVDAFLHPERGHGWGWRRGRGPEEPQQTQGQKGGEAVSQERPVKGRINFGIEPWGDEPGVWRVTAAEDFPWRNFVRTHSWRVDGTEEEADAALAEIIGAYRELAEARGGTLRRPTPGVREIYEGSRFGGFG